MDVENTESSGPSVRESLESTISELAPSSAPSQTPAKTDATQPAKISAKDSAKQATSPTKQKAPEVEHGASNPRGSKETGDTEPKTEQPALRPPNSWKPSIREKWGTLPREVQQEVIRREREASSALTQSDEARKGWNEFKETLAPYQAHIAADGAKPMEAVKSLFDTAMALRVGTPQRKAQLVASMIQNYGIPVEMLAQALDGQAPQQQSQSPYRDPRIDELYERINQATESRNRNVVQKYTSEAQSFAEENEFFPDVRESMAKLIESGFADNFQQAYEKACLLDADINAILKQRKQAERAKQQQGNTQKSRNASSSIRSRPTISPKDGKGSSDVRSVLEAAFAAHSR